MSQEKIETIKFNDVEYVRKDSIISKQAESLDGMKYVIVRTFSAGVFAGYLKCRNGKEVSMVNARRLYQWAGAASLSQMAVDGTNKPTACKFPVEVPNLELTEAIEILECSEKARLSIKEVPVWKV